MAYSAPTPSDFQKRFPKFGSVDAPIVQAALTRALRRVDVSWQDDDRLEGVFLYAAHELTLDGHGDSTEAQSAAAGTLGYKSITSGSLGLHRFDRTAGDEHLDSTAYGQRFRSLLRLRGAQVAVLNNRVV